MVKFEQELCGNDAVKGKLDGKSKHKSLCETQWCRRTNSLETFKAAFSVTVIAQEHIQTNGDGKSGINLSVLCYLTLFYH